MRTHSGPGKQHSAERHQVELVRGELLDESVQTNRSHLLSELGRKPQLRSSALSSGGTRPCTFLLSIAD